MQAAAVFAQGQAVGSADAVRRGDDQLGNAQGHAVLGQQFAAVVDAGDASGQQAQPQIAAEVQIADGLGIAALIPDHGFVRRARKGVRQDLVQGAGPGRRVFEEDADLVCVRLRIGNIHQSAAAEDFPGAEILQSGRGEGKPFLAPAVEIQDAQGLFEAAG